MIANRELRAAIEEVTLSIAEVFAIDAELSRDDVGRLHNRFVECVESVNGRLRRCDELMRKGLRGEALQECEVAPLLLDVVTQLDIPEWEGWASYVGGLGIAPQPKLLLDVAASLNHAYTEQQPLEELLRLYRLHSLARSPIKLRISILIRLVQADPSNLLWADDLRTFQTARLSEISAEFNQLKEAPDLAAAAALVNELSDKNWVVALPRELVTGISESHARLRKKEARCQLKSLVPSIDAAFSADDLDKGLQIREKWDQFQEEAELSDQDDLWQDVSAAFDWMDQEASNRAKDQEARQALHDLEVALDDERTDRSELNKRLRAVERLEKEIPTQLRSRVDRRFEHYEQALKRQSIFRIASILAAVTTVAFLTWMLLDRQNRARQTTDATSRLTTFLENERFEEAQEFALRLKAESPGIFGSQAVQEIIVKVNAAVSRESERQDRFRQLVDQAFGIVTPQASWDVVERAEKLLREAESIAKGDAELVELRGTESRVQTARFKLQSKADAAFNNRFDQIKDRLSTLDALELNELRDVKNSLRELAKAPRVSRILYQSSQLPALIKRVEQRERSIEVRGQRRNMLAKLTESVGRQPSFGAVLSAYAKTFPSEPRSQDFQQVVDNELSYTIIVNDWNDLVLQWDQVRIDDPSLNIDEAVGIVNQLQSRYTDYPSINDLSALNVFLQDMKKRRDLPDGPLQAFAEMLKHEWFSMNSLEERKSGIIHYFFGAPRELTRKEIEVSAIVDAIDTTNIEPLKLRRIDLVKREGNNLYGRSPQTEFAEKALRIIRNHDYTFEKKILAVLDSLYEQKGVDPILRTLFLQLIGKLGAENSHILEEHLAGFLTSVQTKQDLGTINWLDYDSQSLVISLRAKLAAQLERIAESPRDIFRKRVQPNFERLMESKTNLPRLSWVGVLMMKENGSWVSVPRKGESIQNGSDILIRDFMPDGTSSFAVIGRWDDGVVLDLKDVAHFVQGRPVYAFDTN